MCDSRCGVAMKLWGDTPQDAFQRAIEAQRQPIWHALWLHCVNAAQAPPPSADKDETEWADSVLGLESVTRATDAAVIVAGFVLSVPWRDEKAINATATMDEANEDCSSSPTSSTVRRYVCVSIGAGSRCLGVQTTDNNNTNNNGGCMDSGAEAALQRALELRDGHAEVMARRGFVAFLIDLAEAGAQACADDAKAVVPFLELRHGAAGTPACGWVLRPDVRVHLVCSRWMCGSLAAVAGGAGRSGHLLLRAGCGCWVSGAVKQQQQQQYTEERTERKTNFKDGVSATAAVTDGVSVNGHLIAAHYAALDGAADFAVCARVKPGRGRPNLTMSCTDKVWRWAAAGLQGRRRSTLFPLPMRLSSVHVLTPTAAAKCGAAAAPQTKAQCDATDDAEAAGKLFAWRTRFMWPGITPTELAVVTPVFERFHVSTASDAAAQAALPSFTTSHPATVAVVDKGESSYSRSRWLSVRRSTPASAAGPATSHTLPRKRARSTAAATHDDAAADTALAPGLSTLCLEWAANASGVHGGSPNTLVLNTKAGLPQGMTARGLAQRARKGRSGAALPVAASSKSTHELGVETCDGGGDAEGGVWRQCPLSRLWMAHRLASAEAVTRTAFAAANMTHSFSSTPQKTFRSDDTAFQLSSLPTQPMRDMVHQRHQELGSEKNEVEDPVLFLWASRDGSRKRE